MSIPLWIAEQMSRSRLDKESETVEVARIALRLPPFWKSNVRLVQYPTTKSFGNSCLTINSATESIAMPPSSASVPP
ncbi:hypothetical protein TNCV_3202521 [Trichonephila clavipes]|nr:hypothetical protein TNCV_3202521 [Trichonephila clavipes]